MISDLLPHRPRWMGPVLWIELAVIAALILWSFFGVLDIFVVARGRFVPSGQLSQVQAGVAGEIVRIHVRDGTFVRANDVMVEIDPTPYSAEVEVLKERISQIEAQLDRLDSETTGAALRDLGGDSGRRKMQESILHARAAAVRERSGELKALLDGKAATLAAGLEALENLRARLALAEEKVERAKPNVDTAIPHFQYLQWRAEALELAQSVSIQQGINGRLRTEVEEARQRILQVSSERRTLTAMETSEKSSLLTQLQADLERAQRKLASTRVRAPHDGYVQRVAVTTRGANVGANDLLVVLVPNGVPLVMEVLIPNSERAFLRAGQQVSIKLDAYPFQQYGKIKGRLDWISPDAEFVATDESRLPQPAARRTGATTQYFYRGRALVDDSGASGIHVAPGLTGQVDIQTDQRRVIDFFLFPVRQALDEALTVR